MGKHLDNPLDLTNIPTRKTNGDNFIFIEANAGTGKTYSLIEIYHHFLQVKKTQPQAILVISYTNNAVAEIKLRIKKKHPQINLKDLQVYTFHGLAYKIVNDYNVITGELLKQTIANEKKDEIFEEAFTFFYNQYFLQEDKIFLHYLVKSGYFKKLKEYTRTLNEKFHLKIHPLVKKKKSYTTVFYHKQRNKVKDIFASHFNEIKNILEENKENLNGTKFRNPEDKLAYLRDFFHYPQLYSLIPFYNHKKNDNNNLLIFFSLERMKNNCKKGKELEINELLITFLQELKKYQEITGDLENAFKNNFHYYCQLGKKVIDEHSQSIKNQQKILLYNDLMEKMSNLLNKEKVISIIAGQYQAVLVDEFQDTDEIQSKFLQALHKSNPHINIYCIGDPKQSIYGFRNANLHIYLNSRPQIFYTLTENFRSSTMLINAINFLYQGIPHPFSDERINYEPSKKGERKTPELLNDYPVIITKVSKEENQKSIKKKIIQNLIARIKGISHEDTAILVPKNKDVFLVSQELLSERIPFTIIGKEENQVKFLSREIIILLEALIHNTQAEKIKALLVTSFFNYSLEKIKNLPFYELTELMKILKKHYHYWVAKGVYYALFSFIKNRENNNLLNNIAHDSFKENKFFGMLTLLNIIHLEEQKAYLTPLELLNYCKNNLSTLPDDALENATSVKNTNIKVMTIHKSKGLEFNNVFLPFSALDGDNSHQETIFYEKNNYFIDIESDEKDANQEKSKEEKKQEKKRLLYVALTRAKERLFLYFPIEKKMKNTVFNELINPDKLVSSDFFKIENLEDFDHQPATSSGKKPIEEKSLVLNKLSKPLISEGYLASYSSIKSNINDLDFSNQKNFYSSSAFLAPTPNLKKPNPDATSTSLFNLLDLPLGSNTGKCLHAILEKWDGEKYSKPNDFLVETELKNYLIDLKFKKSILDYLSSLAITHLKTDNKKITINFSKTAKENKWLKESEFYLAIKRTKKKIIHSFLELLKKHHYLLEKFVYQENLINPTLQDLTIENGFLKGFIDLVIEKDNQYFIIDWKSNFLGSNEEDYQPHYLKHYLLEKNYFLQGFIYTLALDVFLEKTLKEKYSYEKNFGGVFYIFLRGFKSQEKSSNGHYFFRFDYALLEYFKKQFII